MVKRFYIGTYTNGISRGLYYTEVDFANGQSRVLQAVDMKSPSLVAYSPDRRKLYAVQEFDTDRSFTAFSVRPDGTLSFINTATVPQVDICHVQVAPDASFLVGSSYTAGFVVTLALLPDGAIGPVITLDQHTGHGPLPEQAIARAHCCVFDRSGQYIVSADYGNDSLYVYTHHHGGNLKMIRQYAVPPGYAPRIVTFSDDNRHLYVIHQNGNRVTHYGFCDQTGELTERDSVSCLPEGFTGKSDAAEAQLSPDGRFLYASSRGSDTIACFRLDADGVMTPVSVQPCGGSFPRHFTITRDGGYLLCGNQLSDTVTVFSRDKAGGLLSSQPLFSVAVGNPTFILESKI